MAFYVHRSNRTERLVDVLASVATEPLSSVLAPEWVVVSSPGMERWLSMQLSRRLGVWANPAFPFPRKLIDTLLSAAGPDAVAGREAYEPMCMAFGIARELARCADDPRFVDVQRYCKHDTDARRRLALATRLSELFDQYLTYRPELILDWVNGGGEGFQPELFRALAARHGSGYLAASARKALAALASGCPLPGWPERVHLFGLSSLPPLYLELLSAVSRAHDVHLYLLAPSREYFADLRPTRGRNKRGKQRQLSFDDPGFQSSAHPLLASLGRHAREFQELIEAATPYRELGRELYEDPGDGCVLHVLQSDLLALRTRGPGEELPLHRLEPSDTSFAIHACHSPMRELEVLHDQLARLIAEHGVEPSEIIVMTPNIADYAKVIDAVFSQPESQRPSIPFRIADRGPAETQPFFLALEAVFDVLSGRFGANQVLDLLGFDLLRERFEIAIDQLDEVRAWLEQSGIRWGVDAAHRQQEAQPACDDNTWTQGLARLALGYSSGLPPEQLFLGRSPVTLANDNGELLGHLLEFCSSLFALRRELLTPASAATWVTRIDTLTQVLFGEHVDAAERKQLSRALRELAAHAERAEFSEPFDLLTLRRLLDQQLRSELPAHGFLSAGVTFCQLLPMRSIPFKVVCLLGLNDGVFPASDQPFAFDLMQRQRRLGDRSRKDDDRQLLLEALLSAREHLLISFVGQSQQSGKAMPASVLVYELVEQIARSCELPGQAGDVSWLTRVAQMEERLLLRHPLSGTSPRYFGADPDPRLFSFALANCDAARVSQRREPVPPAARFAAIQAASEPRPSEVSLLELERCLMRPAREFCQRRLQLYLGDDLSALPEREPFELNQLEKWQLATERLAHLAQGRPEASRLEVQRARARLPYFVSGELVYEQLESEVSQLHAELEAFTRGEPARSLDVDLVIDGIRVFGQIGDVWPAGHVRVQYSQLGRRHELRPFVRQVVLRCLAEQQPSLQVPQSCVLIGRRKAGQIGRVCFAVEGSAHDVLRELLALYMEALRAPLPLFALASRTYAEQVFGQAADEDTALRAARAKFGDRHTQAGPESDLGDDYVQQLFGDFEHMHRSAQGGFERAARRLYVPLLAARREL